MASAGRCRLPCRSASHRFGSMFRHSADAGRAAVLLGGYSRVQGRLWMRIHGVFVWALTCVLFVAGCGSATDGAARQDGLASGLVTPVPSIALLPAPEPLEV